MNIRNLIVSLMMITGLFAQSIVGTVNDANNNPLVGANVVVEGTELGSVSDDTGAYVVDVDPGNYTITATFIGYSSVTQEVTVGESNVNADFTLVIDAVTMSALEVLASRADEKTYEKEVSKLGKLSFGVIKNEEADIDKFCNNDSCEIPPIAGDNDDQDYTN